MNTQLTLAQTALAPKMGLGPQWVGVLAPRLELASWIEHFNPTLSDGSDGSTIFCIGRQLKCLLVMLSNRSVEKIATKLPANRRWRFSPHKREK